MADSFALLPPVARLFGYTFIMSCRNHQHAGGQIMKNPLLCIPLVLTLTATACAGVSPPVKGKLSSGSYHGVIEQQFSGAADAVQPVLIALDNGSVVAGEARYVAETDRYDIKISSLFAHGDKDKATATKETVTGYVIAADGKKGYPARLKNVTPGSSTLKDSGVTVYVQRKQ